MATKIICDGCNEPIETGEEVHVVGFFRKREYCDKCFPAAVQYLESRDALHDVVADKWRKGLKRINKNGLEQLEELPDHDRS